MTQLDTYKNSIKFATQNYRAYTFYKLSILHLEFRKALCQLLTYGNTDTKLIRLANYYDDVFDNTFISTGRITEKKHLVVSRESLISLYMFLNTYDSDLIKLYNILLPLAYQGIWISVFPILLKIKTLLVAYESTFTMDKLINTSQIIMDSSNKSKTG